MVYTRLSWWIQSSLRLAVSEKQFDLTLDAGARLHPLSIFLVEVKFPAVMLSSWTRDHLLWDKEVWLFC